MAAITSQLDVAYNLSSLCRQVLSGVEKGEGARRTQASQLINQDRIVAQGQVRGEKTLTQQHGSFLTEVPAEPRSGGHAGNTTSPAAGKAPGVAPVDVSPPRKAAHGDGRVHNQDVALAPGPLTTGRDRAHARPPNSSNTASSELAPRRHQSGGEVPTSSLDQARNNGERSLEEEAAVPPEAVPSSWSSMVSEHHGQVGEHPSSIPEESFSWSGYVSEFQPATPSETALVGISVENGLEPDDPTGEGTLTKSMGYLGGEVRETKITSEGPHGGGERHGGLALDNEYERDSVVPGTTTGSGEADGHCSRRIAELGERSGAQAKSPRGLCEAIPLGLRPAPESLHPVPEPGDPYGDGEWDDQGDDVGDDGNWSSWLASGGSEGAMPTTSNR